MTDAMSRREIEDVLSSIRRLVSHDVRPTAPFLQAAQSGSSAGPHTGEKLLLTSALRVDGPGAAPQPDADATVRLDAGSEALSGAVHVPFGPGAYPGGEQGDSDAYPTGSEMHMPAMERPQMERPQPLPASETVQTDPTEGGAELPFDEIAPRLASHTPSLLARISGAGHRPEAEPDLSCPLSGSGRIGTGLQEAARLPEDRGAETGPEDLQSTDMRPSFAPSAQTIEDSALETTLARLEELLAGTVRNDGTAVVAQDAADRSEDLIDEGVLYQLVAHIVRQELQGELGEKITRNIRKLVRSEVARELQLRQF